MRIKVMLAIALILVCGRTVDPRSLLLWALCGYGLTFLVKDATIFERPRAWFAKRNGLLAAMLECSFCTGFHVGWVLSIAAFVGLGAKPLTPMLNQLAPHLESTQGWTWGFRALVGVWLDGVWFAITSYLLDTLALWLERENDHD